MVSHFVAPKSDAKAFKYEISSFILYTNSKLYKIGFKVNDLCSFSKAESEAFHSFIFALLQSLFALNSNDTGIC